MIPYLWQLYDERGNPLPDGGAKLEIIIKGRLHGSAHLWVWRKRNDDIELLIQKKSHEKINWPNHYDKTSGGHLLYGETTSDNIIRKAKEEIGLSITPNDLKLIGMFHWKAPIENTGFTENEFQWVYLAERNEAQIKLNPHEVEGAQWMPLHTFKRAIISPKTSDQFVPYGKIYYAYLVQSLEKFRPRVTTASH